MFLCLQLEVYLSPVCSERSLYASLSYPG
jgi:hypothetical protein